ncbi:unnamed protein product [Cyprideis torosa]|uniref:Uncharacterized protein n=1 Tax=Cyprideis torosa TaxID=163714 RepID=A0A7R8WTE9_9CRUS|nr:unnamed protein product [Cyprideis torosa]CAG0904734.1 unnamed protein product [Cyprideis torosa]
MGTPNGPPNGPPNRPPTGPMDLPTVPPAGGPTAGPVAVPQRKSGGPADGTATGPAAVPPDSGRTAAGSSRFGKNGGRFLPIGEERRQPPRRHYQLAQVPLLPRMAEYGFPLVVALRSKGWIPKYSPNELNQNDLTKLDAEDFIRLNLTRLKEL